jgi:hypothetical protein
MPRVLVLLLLLLVATFAAACSTPEDGDDPAPVGDDDTAPPTPVDPTKGGAWFVVDECRPYLDDWLPPPFADTPAEEAFAVAVESANGDLRAAMAISNASYAEKVAALRMAARTQAPRLAVAARDFVAAGGSSEVGAFVPLLAAALTHRLETATLPSAVARSDSGKAGGDFALDLTDANLDRYWMHYHWAEVLGGYYDDSAYPESYAFAGRRSFIDEEIGEAGVELTMDYWRVPSEVWNDAGLTDGQRLMRTKFTMWDNPDWSEQPWVPEYWKLQPAWTDEDCPLFTGNTLASLAFEYPLTRLPRTLARMQAIVRALRLLDRYVLDSGHPLNTELPDGRIQRGPTTKNFYPDQEKRLANITFNPFHFEYGGDFFDRQTGRERKNVSRDQYYGVILGYAAVIESLSALDARTDAEQELLCDAVVHLRMMFAYLFGPRFKFGWGWEYNLYSFFEGALANPPNLTFMTLWAYPGYEALTGNDYADRFGVGNRLIHALLRLGAIVGGVELSQKLFDPAQSGLTALNQYMITLYLSDLSPEEWLFIYPPEVLLDHPERRTLWRRVIALSARKYGRFVSPVYRDVIDEMVATETAPPSLADISWHVQNGYNYVEPQVRVEDYHLPLMTIASAAANAPDVAARLAARYDALVASGAIDFAGTDLPEGR